jgi:hypothetical protein
MKYELIQTITGIVGSITGITGIISILLFLRQIKNESEWRKISFSIDKIDTSLLVTNIDAISGSGIDMRVDTMSDEEYENIINNSEYLQRVLNTLDILEDFSTLYNMKVLSEYYAYESYSETVILFYLKFKRIIDYYREKYDPFFYSNFKICAEEFIKKKDDEQKKYKKNNIKLQAKRRKPRIFKEKF